ncbi:unnamed protein product [Blepharisma stoltei]|uniref:Uncharacterized protein n=1 Tax=Blepharisma stoltei TaxID=1481888 RepID=A0AAU9IDW8_9CILI|nr:unnamed protein product [Blepharisma stoltei]
MNQNNPDYVFKLVIIGDSGVGKSCLLIRYAENTFAETHVATIGVDFLLRNLSIDGESVRLQIWDTAGQERFRTIITGYYRNADGVIFVFDKTKRDSFDHIEDWLKEVERYSSAKVVKVLVGNKADLQPHAVTTEEAKLKADQLNLEYIEASAKSAFQVDLIFDSVARKIIQKTHEAGIVPLPEPKNKLSSSASKQTQGCCW